MTVDPAEYRSTTQLPDALAFVKPAIARMWIELSNSDDSLSASELETRLGCSNATVYRYLERLEELDLVERTNEFEDMGPVVKYRATRPTERPVWERAQGELLANGGDR